HVFVGGVGTRQDRRVVRDRHVHAGRSAGDGQVHGWVRLLHGYRGNGHVVHAVVFAVVGKPRSAPEAQDDVHNLLKALGAGVVLHFEVVILVDHLAATYPKIQPSVTQHVEHGGFLGHENRVVEGEHA